MEKVNSRLNTSGELAASEKGLLTLEKRHERTCHEVWAPSKKPQPRTGQLAGQPAEGHASSEQGPNCPALPHGVWGCFLCHISI